MCACVAPASYGYGERATRPNAARANARRKLRFVGASGEELSSALRRAIAESAWVALPLAPLRTNNPYPRGEEAVFTGPQGEPG